MIEEFAGWLVYAQLGLPRGSRLAEALNFFLYDTIKIFALLFFMVFAIGTLRTYITPSRVRALLSGRREGIGNLYASMFGAVTPFCSCSSIPIFIGFLEAGVPIGVAFSFLITSPLINEYLAVIMLGAFGLKITALYILAGLLIGLTSGLMLGRMGVKKELVKGFLSKNHGTANERSFPDMNSRLKFGLSEARGITGKIWLWVIAGVGMGALLHGYVPEDTLHSLVGSGGFLSVPIATLVGIPLYANCAAIVPIAAVLVGKGMPLGTALAFMMSTSALSLPEAVILRRVMHLKLIARFFGIVAASIILIGYLFNYLA